MNALKSLIIVFLLLVSNTAYSQTASKVGNVYQIPFATEGNRVDLEVANVGAEEMAAVRVVTSQKPEWLHLDMNEIVISGVESETDAIASFGFSVDREAPIGEGALLRFDILSGNKVIGVKEFVLAVAAPSEAALDQNFPNPFRQSTTIGFDNPAEGAVQIGVYDMLGRQVSVLLDEERAAGHHKVHWDASGLASGMYFYILKTNGKDGSVGLLRNKMIVVH